MTWIRKTGPVLMAILILCLLMAMPPLFAVIKEKTLLNRIVMEEIPENMMADSSKGSLSMIEKLELINNGRMGSGDTALASVGIFVENDDIMKERAFLELEKLLELQAIMYFDTSDCRLIYGTPLNYVDLKDVSRSVTVMELELEFSSMIVDVWMDVETSQIYEYTLHFESYSIARDWADVSEIIENFREYTGLSREEFEYYYDYADDPVYIMLKVG